MPIFDIQFKVKKYTMKLRKTSTLIVEYIPPYTFSKVHIQTTSLTIYFYAF